MHLKCEKNTVRLIFPIEICTCNIAIHLAFINEFRKHNDKMRSLDVRSSHGHEQIPN